mmetsp:Transcript_4264/g.12594  ORF Transcript_4264/g.12594 Transcript_4264/m.12594 type:complete len:212 (+) Transcript_4264:614-1249(+)
MLSPTSIKWALPTLISSQRMFCLKVMRQMLLMYDLSTLGARVLSAVMRLAAPQALPSLAVSVCRTAAVSEPRLLAVQQGRLQLMQRPRFSAVTNTTSLQTYGHSVSSSIFCLPARTRSTPPTTPTTPRSHVAFSLALKLRVPSLARVGDVSRAQHARLYGDSFRHDQSIDPALLRSWRTRGFRTQSRPLRLSMRTTMALLVSVNKLPHMQS